MAARVFSDFFNPNLILGKRKLRRSLHTLKKFKIKSGVCMVHPERYSMPAELRWGIGDEALQIFGF